MAQQSKATVAALEKYKNEVKNVALQYARDNGWCGEIYEALGELGIEVKPERFHVTVELSVDPREDETLNVDNLEEVSDEVRNQFDNWNYDHRPKIVKAVKVEG